MIPAWLIGKSLRILGQNPSDKDIQHLLRIAGKNDDDKIDFEEFKCIISRYKFKSEKEMLEDITEAFKVFDRQEVGVVRMCELKSWLAKGEEHLPYSQIEELINMSGGKPTDESFDYNEFLKILVSKQAA